MSAPEASAYAEVIAFSGRVVAGELGEAERAGVAALLVLLGAGRLTGARIPVDEPRRDEFAALMWEVATALVEALLAGVAR